eukprot:7038378-Alexandrium_andersonii.AAC.1
MEVTGPHATTRQGNGAANAWPGLARLNVTKSATASTDSARFARVAEPAESTETLSSVPRAVDPHRPRAIAVYLARAAK